MAREQLKTLTEPMYYLLLALKSPRNGAEISDFVKEITEGRVELPPGTLYSLLAQFTDEMFIEKVESQGPGKKYQITKLGLNRLMEEKNRLVLMIDDYEKY